MRRNANPHVNMVGGNGGAHFNDTAIHTLTTDTWCCIYCLAACTFTTLTSSDVTSITNLNQITMQPGMAIYGIFTQIQLASGAVMAYYG